VAVSWRVWRRDRVVENEEAKCRWTLHFILFASTTCEMSHLLLSFPKEMVPPETVRHLTPLLLLRS